MERLNGRKFAVKSLTYMKCLLKLDDEDFDSVERDKFETFPTEELMGYHK